MIQHEQNPNRMCNESVRLQPWARVYSRPAQIKDRRDEEVQVRYEQPSEPNVVSTFRLSSAVNTERTK